MLISIFSFNKILTSNNIEYKFVSMLNNWEISKAFEMMCSYENKDNSNIKYNYELSKILSEDTLFKLKNFHIERNFSVWIEKSEFKYGFMLWYDVFYAEYWVIIKRVIDKKWFVKIKNEKECIVFED